MSSFLLKEYTALEAEMNAAVKETRELERYALGVTGAVWAWVVGSGAGTVKDFLKGTTTHDWMNWLPVLIVLLLPALLVSFLPVALVWFLKGRACALTGYIDDLAKYLAEVEKKFELDAGYNPDKFRAEITKVKNDGRPPLYAGFGWEQWLEFSELGKSKRATAERFWKLLFCATFILPAISTALIAYACFRAWADCAWLISQPFGSIPCPRMIA